MKVSDFIAECERRGASSLTVRSGPGIHYSIPLDSVQSGVDDQDGRCYCYGFRITAGGGRRKRVRAGTVRWFFLENVSLT